MRLTTRLNPGCAIARQVQGFRIQDSGKPGKFFTKFVRDSPKGENENRSLESRPVREHSAATRRPRVIPPLFSTRYSVYAPLRQRNCQRNFRISSGILSAAAAWKRRLERRRPVMFGLSDAQTKNCPPFAEIVEPVMKPASSEARNTTQRAISSGSPRRPTGICGMMRSLSTFSGTARTISVPI